MGMDIYLFEVLEPDSDGEEFDFFEDEFEEVPDEIKEKAYWKDYEVIDVEKIVEDFGKTIEDIVAQYFGNEYVIWFKDGSSVKLSWDEVDRKYTVVERRPTIKVRELAYRRYAYCGIYFKVSPLCQTEEAEKRGLKRNYFDPDEMLPVLDIFVDGSRWMEIVEEFRKAKQEGKLCFVHVSY